MMDEEIKEVERKHESEFDIDTVEPSKHNWVQIDNRLECIIPGHTHAQFLRKPLTDEELDKLNGI